MAYERNYLDEHLSHRRIGQTVTTTCHLPDGCPEVLTVAPYDFFLSGYLKGKVFFPNIPIDLAEMKQRTLVTIDGLHLDTLTRFWADMEDRHECHVNKG